MKKIYIILIFFLMGTLCNAQSYGKRYNGYLSANGIVNFFRPQKLKNNANIDMFVFDMTYISYSDSVTLNCSYKAKNGDSIKSLNLKSDNHNIYADDLSIIYREVQKNGYEVRITSRFSFQDIKNVFGNQTPLAFEIVLNDGSFYRASYRKSAWNKERSNMTRILESINY